MINLLIILAGVLMYVKGETETKWLGKSDKVFKYAMGVPMALLGVLGFWSWVPLIAALTYFIACEFGYGENNPLTKLLGKRGAITFCGGALGLASFPFIGWMALVQCAISATAFYYIAELDDNGVIKEPWVAIWRAIFGTLLILLAR